MVTVDVSPYCELARWMLDRLGIAYDAWATLRTSSDAAIARHDG